MVACRGLVLVVIVLALIGKISGKPPKKIVNGENAAITDYPWVVFIQRYTQYYCGGTFISTLYVLTAAHCLSEYENGPPTLLDKNTMSVVSGTNNVLQPRYTHGIQRFDIHPKFTGVLPSFLHDIGIITLASPMIPDIYQNVARLPTSEILPGTFATVLGWGYLVANSGIISEWLKKTSVVTRSNSECNLSAPTPIFRDQVCASSNNTGFCSGDSGGPLLSYDTVIGIVSMTWECGKSMEVYTRSSSYLSWIGEVMGRPATAD